MRPLQKGRDPGKGASPTGIGGLEGLNLQAARQQGGTSIGVAWQQRLGTNPQEEEPNKQVTSWSDILKEGCLKRLLEYTDYSGAPGREGTC